MEKTQTINYVLRDYQINLIQNIYKQWKEGKTKVIAQLPTGAGKTICFAAIAREFACRGEKVIVLAHREELVLQAADKLGKVTGQEVGIIKAKYQPNYSLSVQIASVQSLVRRASVIEKVGLIIIDEAHHSTANTYRKILERYPEAYQLGVTATPIRLDGVGFKDLFDELVCGVTIKELIKQKYLSRFRLYADPNPMSTKGVRMAQGDYSVRGLEKVNNIIELSGNLIKSYLQYAQGKRCIVFAISVEHSKMITAKYNEAGIPAYHLDGNTAYKERREAIEKFRKGEFLILSNCQLFDEGLDIPGLEAVQIAKPTKSLTRWLQMVGRALRPMEGKKYAVVLDHTKNWAIHGLPNREREWTLDGVEEKEKVETKRNAQGEVIESEIKVEETENILEEIESTKPLNIESENIEPLKTEEERWLKEYEELIYKQRVKGYNKGWIYYRLKEIKPPLFIWQEYGQLRGYHPKWAKYQFKEQEELQKQEEENKLRDFQIIWDKSLDKLHPLTQRLIIHYTKLLSFDGKVLRIAVEKNFMVKYIMMKESEIRESLNHCYQKDIVIELIA
jgi:superfamily II DNA or RNA helicase